MLDVVEPEENDDYQSNADWFEQAGRMSKKKQELPEVQPENLQPRKRSRVVELQWKLPARLRKPVREQLQKERARRRRQRQVVQFQRKRIHTQPVFKMNKPSGAEAHTGDTYRTKKPKLKMALPPYKGTAWQSATAPKKRTGARAPEQFGRRMQPRKTKRPIPAERDVPYSWDGLPKAKPQERVREKAASEAAQGAVQRPTNRLALPFSFSLLPRGLWEGGSQTSKKKLHKAVDTRHSAVGVLVLALMLTGSGLVLWNLQGVGRGLSVLDGVRSLVEQAVGQFGQAGDALAQAQYEEGHESLVEAEALLQEARSQMDEALQFSKVILRYADVSGQVRSGDELLRAGERLSRGAQSLVAGVAVLQGGHTEEPSMDLAERVATANESFTVALSELQEAERALEAVSVARLPEDIQDPAAQLKTLVPRVRKLLELFVSQADTLLYLLGADHDRQYLLAFANNHELRPVGGFIGTTGLVTIDRGQIEHIDVQSVYHRDGQLQEFVAPPTPLLPIVDRWYMRDTNWFVDFPVSAQKMADFLEKEGGPTVDGVVLMTPEVIERMLALTGPIALPEYGVEVTSENFVQLTQQLVSYEYDKEANRPKQFLSDLAPLLLEQVLEGEGQQDQFGLLMMFLEAMQHKELLLYFEDEEAQKSLEKFGWDGSYPKDRQGFLAVNNANIGGHKSDQFIEQEIDYRSVLDESGDVEVVLTIRREHRGPHEAYDYEYPPGEDPAYKDNVVYQRVFVPEGAQLLEVNGYTPFEEVPKLFVADGDLPVVADPEVASWQQAQTFDKATGTALGMEMGYRYFANWIVTKPGQTTVTLYRYRLPGHAKLPSLFDAASSYGVYVAKQPGAERTKIRTSLDLPVGLTASYVLPEEGVSREEGRIGYETALDRDRLLGIVLE